VNDVGRGLRTYLGGASEATALTTVVREIPSRSAIRDFGTPSAASLLISAQSSKVITLQSLSVHFSSAVTVQFSSVADSDGIRRRVIGATLMIVGVLMLLFAPLPNGYVLCAGASGAWRCPDYRTSFWDSIHWPRGWADKLTLPMRIIGVALVLTGTVLRIRARRSRDTAR